MSEPINLLLVEDNELDAVLLVRELRKAGFDVNMERVQSAPEMQSALLSRKWDAVISDFKLPAFSAPKALEILRKSGQDLPFIVVSGTIGEETAVEIMRSGAHDYLMKGNLSRLAEALRREIRDARGRKESRRSEIALRQSEQQLRLLFERSNDAIFVIDKQNGGYLNANKAAEKLSGMALTELMSKKIYEVAPKDTKERIQQITDTDDPLNLGEVTYLQPGGSTRIAELTILPVNDEIVFGVAHDITEQIQAANAFKRRAQELEALYSTSLEINSQTNLITLLRTIVEQAVSLLNSHMGELNLVSTDGKSIELVVAHNMPNSPGAIIKLGEGLSGKIALSGKTMVIEDYSTWEGRAASYENVPIRRTIGVPLRVNGRVIGVISVSDDHITGSYTPDEIRLVSLFADQAAIAVENARLLDAAQRELSERKQAELALRESEERYRIIVTQAPLISFVVDSKGMFTLSEGKSLSSLGLKPGEVVGQSAFEFYKDHAEIIEDLHRALTGEERHRDTKIGNNTFDVHYIPIFEDGEVTRLIGVANDITERVKADNLVRESESSYRGLFNSVAEAIHVLDGSGRFLDANEGAIHMYGYPREEIIGRTLAFLAAPGKNNLDTITSAIQSAFEGKQPQFEFWGLRKNGEIFPNEVSIYRGTYFGQDVAITLAQDITERKQSEQALQRRLKEITILHNIAKASIIVNTIDELVEMVTLEVGHSFYPDNFGVLFLDEKRNILLAHPSYRGITEDTREITFLEKSIAGPVVLTGKPRRIPDVRLEPNYMEVTADIHSELCVPIKTGEQIIGVINAESKQLDFFSDDDERLLLTISNQMAIAIERIRLFNSERERRQEAEILRQATAALSTSLDLDHVLNSLLVSLRQVVPYNSASVFMLEGDLLRITTTQGFEDSNPMIGKTFQASDVLFQEVKTKRHAIILEDAQLDPRFNRWGETSNIHGWMSVPLITRGEVIGYITLDNREKSAYNQEAGALAQAFAHQAAAAIDNARLFEGIQESLKELNQAYESTIEGWSKAMDLRDRETEGHTLRVTDMTLKLARAMGLSEEELVHIRRGALLHDIGKMGVPDRILLKPDRLKDDELVLMRCHPQYAYDMLSQVDYLRPALNIPYCHHEWWDGSGYPQGLKGEEIPLAARFFAIVDVWDALTSDRPYRPAWTIQETITYIKGLSGKQFEPRIVEKFLELLGINKPNV